MKTKNQNSVAASLMALAMLALETNSKPKASPAIPQSEPNQSKPAKQPGQTTPSVK